MGRMETPLPYICALMQESVALVGLPTHPGSIELDHRCFQGAHHSSQSMVFQKHLPRCHDNNYLVSLDGVGAFSEDFFPVETEP